MEVLVVVRQVAQEEKQETDQNGVAGQKETGECMGRPR